ncbi:MAG: Maf family protein [Myxococcales bacterium]|jgi:septum formation protein|nr:Maf family protein [Myxococcales bacterium]
MTFDQLVLASASPRREALLSQFGLPLRVDPPAIDERTLPGESALMLASRLARMKGSAVAERARNRDGVVLAADTVVALDGQLLGKPESPDHARHMLQSLSGKAHSVVTGLFVSSPRHRESMAVETRVRFRTLSDAQIDWYVVTGEPLDKAGAYAIQGLGGAFVESIDGSHSNVIGLPLAETMAALRRAGLRLPW